MNKTAPIHYLIRATGERRAESVMGDGALRFAYETALGRTLWPVLFGGGFCSALLGCYYDSRFSRPAAARLAAIPGCCPGEAEKPVGEYPSFNAFFTRRLKAGSRPADPDPASVVSPADGRLLVFPDCGAADPIPVKGARKTLAELCAEKLPETSYAVAVIRLAPVDYHRYHFPCACEQGCLPRVIRGKYHSVNPVALLRRPDLYVENTRQITGLASPVFGDFRMIEVGAFGVGSIVQTAGIGHHEKADEKGYFKFGASTVILMFPANRLTFDADLIAASADGTETLIRCGERIGLAAAR